jgi:hypothetical protein
MKDHMKFRGYATDCRRLAKSMKPEHKATWDQCADEAEHEAGKDQKKKGTIDRRVDGA